MQLKVSPFKRNSRLSIVTHIQYHSIEEYEARRRPQIQAHSSGPDSVSKNI